MGLVDVQENGNGNGDVIEIPLGAKNKYIRMTSEEEEEEEEGFATRKHDSKKYIFACAVFASLNSVLLGYGR